MSEGVAVRPISSDRSHRDVRAAPRRFLALRYALREMRGGLRGFYIFLLCVALGSGTIAGVNSLARGLSTSIQNEGQALLGGDVAFSLIHRRANADEFAFLSDRGRVSTVATLRAMARTPDGGQQLVELKGADALYPLYGTVRLESGQPLSEALSRSVQTDDTPVPAVAEASLVETLGLEPGDTFSLGELTVRLEDVLTYEPDRLSGGVAFGPRVLIPIEALDRSGLVDRGSLTRWRYRVAGADGPLSDEAVRLLLSAAEEQFPSAGWRVETRSEAAPRLRESIDRFAQFLTLVGLTALGIGGVGVANAVRAYVQRKRLTVATLRSLGGRSGFVTQVYLAQIMMLALAGVTAGLLIGIAIPPVAAFFLRDILPVSALTGIYPGALGLAALYGLLTALTFAIWPLGLTQTIRPAALMREETGGEVSARFKWAAAVCAALLAALAVLGAYDRFLAIIYVISAAAVFLVLRVLATAIAAAARAAPHGRSTPVRLALANIGRRGSLTPTVTLSLGLSLTLLVTLALVDTNLRETLTSRLPDRAPSFFFVDIQDRERDAFLARLEHLAPDGSVQSQPMLRGRITAINDVAAADWPDTEASWVLRGDRGITYSATVPENSEIVSGDWWSPDTNEREVSFAAELAAELGVAVGDRVTVNVLGRNVEATITNLRTVAWESLAINFVMIFSPDVFAGAPHAHLATLTLPDGGDPASERDLMAQLADEFPTVTTVRVREALETVNAIVGDLVLAVRAAASVTLIASVLVLAGTLAASHRSRIYDAVILKVLGAPRRTLIAAFALEYALLGLTVAVFGIFAGGVAAFLIVTELMELEFAMRPGAAVLAAVTAVTVTVGLGLIGTFRALGEKPGPVLRNL